MRSTTLLFALIAAAPLCACAAILGVDLDVESDTAAIDGAADGSAPAPAPGESSSGGGQPPTHSSSSGESLPGASSSGGSNGSSSSSSGTPQNTSSGGSSSGETGGASSGGSSSGGTGSSSSGGVCPEYVPYATACDNRCDVIVADGCGGDHVCTLPERFNTCYNGVPCLAQEVCFGQCGTILPAANCGKRLNCTCSPGECCDNSGGALGFCVPQDNGGGPAQLCVAL